MIEPFTRLPFPRAARAIRNVVAATIPPGGKMRFNQFAAMQPPTALSLLVGWAEDLSAHAEAYLGEPVTAMLPLGSFRHHAPDTPAEQAPWHTDAIFFREVGRGVTFWITFDKVGETAPALEFETGAPCLEPGTALMFGPDVRHRTQPIPGGRISVEFRCVPTAARVGEFLDAIQASVVGDADARRLVLSSGGKASYERDICLTRST